MRSKWTSNFQLGIGALRRDWQSGELRLLILALVIAVAAVTSVGFLADRVAQALSRNSAQMLGADLALESSTPIASPFINEAHREQLATSETLVFPSMASSAAHTQLVSLKAVAAGYPLRGAMRVADSVGGVAATVSEVPDAGTVWVDAQVLSLLDVRIGGVLQVGDLPMKITKIISFEPDRGVQFVNVAPRVMMRMDDIAKTGLVGPGSRVRYTLLAAGDARAVSRYKDWLTERLEKGQKLSSLESARPEIQGSLVRAHQFLILVALLTVMIAAVAIALATRRFGLRHQSAIAVMRCLGASQGQLGAILWVEFLALALLASLAGTLLGYAVHQALVSLFTVWLGTALPAPSWSPGLQGLVTGLLLLLGFAVPPLNALRHVPPAMILRREAGLRPRRHWPAYALGLGAFFLLALWISGSVRLSVVVCVGFFLALCVSVLISLACVWLLDKWRHHVHGSSTLRFALAGIVRRKNLSVTQICALSVGLMVLLLLAITRTDLLAGWQNTLPADAPNTFLINIQPDQRESVQARLQQDGLSSARLAPMVRGRLTAIDGQVIDEDKYAEERARRLVEREFNLSYLDELPQGNTLYQGRWLDVTKNEVSIERGLATTLGIKVNDSLTFDVAGQQVQVKVTSLREVKWDSFNVNFFAVLSPAALKDAPATYITSFYLPPSKAAITQKLVHEFPNLTVFDVGSILGQLQFILDQVAQAVQLLFLFTVLAGMAVLAAAFFSTRDERMREVAILRVLGASSAQLSAALYIELFIVGSLAGLLAAAGALSVASVLAARVFDFPLALSWWPWPAGIAAGIIAAGLGGGVALRGVLKTPPLVCLREVS